MRVQDNMVMSIAQLKEAIEVKQAFVSRAVAAKDQHLAPYYFEQLQSLKHRLNKRLKLVEEMRSHKIPAGS